MERKQLMERETLIDLVTRAQNADGEAMETLFSALYNDVYYFAKKTVKDVDIACDITQETFLEIFNTIGTLQEPAAFVTWMKTITYHQCTRYFKKKKDVLLEEDEDGSTIFDTIADESEDSIPEEVLQKKEFQDTVNGMIDELSEEQRSAVLLHYHDDLTVGEIAKIQGVSEGTVKSRLNYARKAVKKSVESYEKKNGIKLRTFSFAPLFLLFLGQKEEMPADRLAKTAALVKKTAGETLVKLSRGGAKAGLSAKIASMPLVTKIIAGVAAAAVVLGGGAALISGSNTRHGDRDLDCVCDSCGDDYHHEAEDHSAPCTICGAPIGIHDENDDSLCDVCGEYPCGPAHGEAHDFANGACIWCGTEHDDRDIDGYCDDCGEAMCLLGMATLHWDRDKNCACDVCGYVEHFHGQGDACGSCEVCGIPLGILDMDGDALCDLCGEGPCGRNHPHTDEDGDEICDFCGHFMCEFWLAEHYVNYDDGIYDEKCDNCGGSFAPIGWFEDENHTYNDADGDNVCDCCSEPACQIYGREEFGGADADGDNNCDICGYLVCDWHVANFCHRDLDHDGKCDICDHFICAHGYIPHTDENGDGTCDNCYAIA